MTKVSELIGAELDAWVARAHGMIVMAYPVKKGAPLADFWGYEKGEGVHAGPRVAVANFKPSTLWQWGGPIIENKRITIDWNMSAGHLNYDPEPCMAVADGGIICYGPTPLVAAMRAFVATVYGDEVSE